MIMGHNNLPANTYNKTRLERQRETKKTNDENIKGIPNKDKYSATDATYLTLDWKLELPPQRWKASMNQY